MQPYMKLYMLLAASYSDQTALLVRLASSAESSAQRQLSSADPKEIPTTLLGFPQHHNHL